VGESLQSEPLPDDLEPIEESVQQVEPIKPVVLQTEGVTLHETAGGYVQYDGKSIRKEALQEINPNLFARPDFGKQSSTSFGTEFPKFASKSDIFVRVDTLPNRVFKFDGSKWIEVNKTNTSVYLYDEEYLRYLVSKIETGEYDVDLLSDIEKEQIEEYLSKQTK
jgi:hypothetical protein